MRGKKEKKRQIVEIADPVLVIVIRAELPLTGEDNSIDNEAIESALDALRGAGAAQVIERRVIGTCIGEAKRTL
jgi:hypothetical protein